MKKTAGKTPFDMHAGCRGSPRDLLYKVQREKPKAQRPVHVNVPTDARGGKAWRKPPAERTAGALLCTATAVVDSQRADPRAECCYSTVDTRYTAVAASPKALADGFHLLIQRVSSGGVFAPHLGK